MSKLNEKLYQLSSDLKKDQLPYSEIHTRIVNGVHLTSSPLLILICSSIIASIGLNINSAGAVLGAKLISPLMIMIIGMSYGISTYEFKLSKKAFKYFLLQFLIIVITSTIYFILSPIKAPTDELFEKASASIFDIILAFFGGIACVVATTRYEKYNVLPGVALATSLVPPVCTIGYGIATLNTHFIFGALYKFSLNVIFLMASIFIFFRIIYLNPEKEAKKSKFTKNQIIFISVVLTIAIPVLLSTVIYIQSAYAHSIDESNAYLLVKNELNLEDTTVLNTTVDYDNKVITILSIGDEISNSELNSLTSNLVDYNLENYTINLVQGTDDVLIEFFKDKVDY